MQANRLFFYGIICIRGGLEVEKTQVVCCGKPQNNYFILNSNKISHCVREPFEVIKDHLKLLKVTISYTYKDVTLAVVFL